MRDKMNVRAKKVKMFELQYDDAETNKWITVRYFKMLDSALKGLMSRGYDREWRVVERKVNVKFYSRQEGGDNNETVDRNERNAGPATR